MLFSNQWIKIHETPNQKDLILEFLSKDYHLPSRENLLNFVAALDVDKNNFLTHVFWAIKLLDNLNEKQVNFLESKKRYYLYQYYFTPWALTWEEKEELEEVFFSQEEIFQNTSQIKNNISQNNIPHNTSQVKNTVSQIF